MLRIRFFTGVTVEYPLGEMVTVKEGGVEIKDGDGRAIAFLQATAGAVIDMMKDASVLIMPVSKNQELYPAND